MRPPANKGDRTIIGISLVLAPVFLLLSTLALPPLKSDTAAELAAIGVHHQRYYLFILCGMIASILLLPAFLGLMLLTRDRHPVLGMLGGSLALLGTALSLVDYGSELMKWQAAAGRTPSAQMISLLDRFDGSAGSNLPLQLSGITVLAGTVLLAIGLARGGIAPWWIAAALVAGMFLSLAGFAFSNNAVLDAGSALLIISMGWIGVRTLTTGQHAATSLAPTPASG